MLQYTKIYIKSEYKSAVFDSRKATEQTKFPK